MTDNKMDKMKGQVIEVQGEKWFIVGVMKGKDGDIIIMLSKDYCTDLPWPPSGGECQGGSKPWNNNGIICCKFGVE